MACYFCCLVLQLLISFVVVVGSNSASTTTATTDCDGAKLINNNNRSVIVASLNEWSARHVALALGVVQAEWAWANNLTVENQRIKSAKSALLADLRKKIWRRAVCYDCTGVCSDEESRRLDTYRNIGTAALPASSYNELNYVQSTMQSTYSTAKLCRPDTSPPRCLSLDPDLLKIMTTSSDYCDLLWAWQGWRNSTGPKLRPYYGFYVHLLNEAAVINGMKDAKQMWTRTYVSDEPDFFKQIENAWETIRPLYVQLHAYVRRKLIQKHGADKFPKTGHIPAHLLGNMWAQDWSSLYELVRPDNTVDFINITALLLEHKYDVNKLFQLADELFQSIGMDPMTEKFWNNSVLTKRNDMQMICHASAWDFIQPGDFRIKMCSQVDQSNFLTIHHEMGHIQYFMHYEHLPVEFREGANPGFHEAIGDLVALSVMTPVHLKAIKLLPQDFPENDGIYLNALMKSALEKIGFLPFGYVLDKYRWTIFEKKTPIDSLNSAWWKLMCDFQGVSPPVPRTEEDFDAGSKFHVAASVPYIRYFFSQVVLFQMHVALCKEMGITKDFHKCDIYGNATAARNLREAMRLGASKPYPQALKLITGTTALSAKALMEYYEPLYRWLSQQNEGHDIGWKGNCMTSIIPHNCRFSANATEKQTMKATAAVTSFATTKLSAPSIFTFFLYCQILFLSQITG